LGWRRRRPPWTPISGGDSSIPMSDADIDPEVLPPLRARLQRLRARLPEIVDAMEGDLIRANRALVEGHADLEQRARQIRREAEDEDADWRAEQQAEEAEDELRRFRQRLEDLGNLVARYRACARRALAHCEGPTLAACTRLDTLYAQAIAALALLPMAGDGHSSIRLPRTPSAARAIPDLPRDAEKGKALASSLPTLPAGFAWVPLDQVHPGPEDWPTPTEFRKMPYNVVCDGLRRFRDEMLPLLREHPAAQREVFEEFDRQHGRTSTGLVRQDSLAHLYDQFFHPGNKMWCWVRRADGRYEFGNGRHRVRAAMDLGLKFVPAEIRTGTTRPLG
jgi:hypothetical protein